jgi:putative FmdB family regulatory protein
MPVYEYQCKACGRDFEYQQRMSDPDKTTCETCGGALERLISRTAFALKGGGWYKDLYASPKPEGGSSDGKPAAGDAKTDGKVEAKPAAAATAADKPAAKPSSDSGGGSTSSGSGSSGASGTGSSGGTGGSSSGSVTKAS